MKVLLLYTINKLLIISKKYCFFVIMKMAEECIKNFRSLSISMLITLKANKRKLSFLTNYIVYTFYKKVMKASCRLNMMILPNFTLKFELLFSHLIFTRVMASCLLWLAEKLGWFLHQLKLYCYVICISTTFKVKNNPAFKRGLYKCLLSWKALKIKW